MEPSCQSKGLTGILFGPGTDTLPMKCLSRSTVRSSRISVKKGMATGVEPRFTFFFNGVGCQFTGR